MPMAYAHGICPWLHEIDLSVDTSIVMPIHSVSSEVLGKGKPNLRRYYIQLAKGCWKKPAPGTIKINADAAFYIWRYWQGNYRSFTT